MKRAARTARGDLTRTRIVRVARQVLVREGPAGLSLRAVAVGAEVSLSNLQFHFASQEALLQAVLDDELTKAQDFVVRAISARPEAPIDAAIDALLALQHKQDSARLFYSMWAVATTSSKMRKALQAFYGRWLELITNVAVPEVAERAWLFVALLEGASLFRCGIVGRSDQRADATLRDELRALLGYGRSRSA